MNIAICDDEQEYIDDVRKHLNLYCSEHGISYELYEFNNSKDILNSKTKYDIALLDIEIDDINGIEIGKQLQISNPEIVLIYITAYDHYLDEAMDLGITRFFSKPINSERFYIGIERAIAKVDNTEVKIYLKDEKQGIETIYCRDIIYVEIYGRKTKVVNSDKTYICKDNIQFWQEKLTKSYFEFPHKSFIINTNFITGYNRDYVILDNQYNIPIAYSKRSEFKRKFMVLTES
ncbi:MAG: LytTR family DNA-binding domain-containing protein [Eubacterium sp.]|nr:LytTR family DNA-binding domain-containing protein [Eubacterium sp.]